MLYIVLAYLMLFAALTNAVSLNNASSFIFYFIFFHFFHWLVQMLLIFMLCHCLFLFLICIMHSAFNMFVFHNYMFTSLSSLFFVFVLKIFFRYFLWKGYELSGEIALKNNHYYYYYDVTPHLQRIQNYAARVILRLPKSSSITTHLKSLHWLPVKERSTYKIACLCYHCHSSTAPSYVADMVHKNHCTPTTLAPAHTPCLFSIDLHTVRQHLVIVHFLLLLLLSGTLFQMMSGVPHHCHHLSLVWRHTCFVKFTKTELYPWSLYICAWLGLVIALLMVFLKNALMCIKNVKLINHDCLPILMVLYIMLYVLLACLMLFAALSNAACVMFLFFLLLIFGKCFLFSCFVLVCWHIVCLFEVWFSIMRSAFNLMVFPNSMSTPFFIWNGYVPSWEIALKYKHYYYYSYSKKK